MSECPILLSEIGRWVSWPARFISSKRARAAVPSTRAGRISPHKGQQLSYQPSESDKNRNHYKNETGDDARHKEPIVQSRASGLDRRVALEQLSVFPLNVEFLFLLLSRIV